MAVLGIESSAHTFGVGIIENGKIIANRKRMYKIGKTGMIPVKVAEFHSKNARSVIESAIAEAGISIADIEAIGYTKGPGLGPCLRVGQLSAKTLAVSIGVPLFPVNHGLGHIEVTRQAFHMHDPIALYVSGGNSQILALDEQPFRHYKVYGETLDIGVGNMLDNFARAAGLNPAWGSTVAKVALGGSYIQMPYTVKGMDFAFAGILTHATKALSYTGVSDVAYSLQETSFAMLCEAVERAIMLTGKKELLTCGGVAQSARLKEMLSLMAMEHAVRFVAAPDELNADNGAMIALVAEKMLYSGARPEAPIINQRSRPDSAVVTW
jgi:N6-L-threonylcarbamoyladenine synthase